MASRTFVCPRIPPRGPRLQAAPRRARGAGVGGAEAAAAEQVSGGDMGRDRAPMGTETKGQEGPRPSPILLAPHLCSSSCSEPSSPHLLPTQMHIHVQGTEKRVKKKVLVWLKHPAGLQVLLVAVTARHQQELHACSLPAFDKLRTPSHSCTTRSRELKEKHGTQLGRIKQQQPCSSSPHFPPSHIHANNPGPNPPRGQAAACRCANAVTHTSIFCSLCTVPGEQSCASS